MDLDLAGVAASFGLIRLPKMPELKTQALVSDVYEPLDIDVSLEQMHHQSLSIFIHSSGRTTPTEMERVKDGDLEKQCLAH